MDETRGPLEIIDTEPVTGPDAARAAIADLLELYESDLEYQCERLNADLDNETSLVLNRVHAVLKNFVVDRNWKEDR